MFRLTRRSPLTPGAARIVLVASFLATPAFANNVKPTAGIGVEPTELSAAVTHRYLALHTLKRAVFLGKERDPETGQAFKVRLEMSVREAPEKVAGVSATVVDMIHYADGEVVEKSRDFFAQHASGIVHYLGEHVDDYDGGKIVGHDGQWVAGEQGNKAGVFMPAAPKVGDVFVAEPGPGPAQNRTKVLSTARTVKVPAGTFKDCIEVEEYDPVDPPRRCEPGRGHARSDPVPAGRTRR